MAAAARAVIRASISPAAMSICHVSREGSLEFGLVVAQRTLERVIRVDAKMVFEVIAIFEGGVAFQALKKGQKRKGYAIRLF